MDKVKIGIIGLGNMGTGHAVNIVSGKVPRMELVAICDTAKSRRKYAEEHFREAKVFDNATDMYKSGLLDAVIIAVPHYSHPSLAIEAFSYGLHVMTEKPAGVYTKQVLEMNEAAKKSGKIFGIMYNQRTNMVYQKTRDLIKSGELGEIKRVTWIITDWYRSQSYHDSCTWRSTWKDEGGGTLINQNPHQLDLWQWMFGMPEKIMSFCSFGRYYNIEVEDDVTAYMQYKNGITGVYITSTGESPGTNRLEIACDMGQLIVENNTIKFKRNIVSEREFNKTCTDVFGQLEYWNCDIPVNISSGESHVGILKNFTAAILDGDELLAPGYEGIKGLTISNAIHYSAFTNKWAYIDNFPHDEFYELLQEKIKTSTLKKDLKGQRTIDADTMATTY